jgi:Mce-associated membrane protein
LLDQLKRLETKRRSPDRTRRLKILLGTVIAVLLAIILILSYLLYRSKDAANDREEALETARRFAIHMSSINHSTLERDIQEIRSVSTTNFHQEFDKATGGRSYHESVRELEATSTGKVVSAVIDSLEVETAKAIVMVEVTSHNKTFQRPKVENRRMEISLRRTETGWMVDHLVSAISTAP